jgi:hypothetical protein
MGMRCNRSYIVWASLFALPAITGCSAATDSDGDPAGTLEPDSASQDVTTPLKYVLNRGANTFISAHTLPNAVCSLLPEGEKDPSRGLRLYADHVGAMNFGLNADATAGLSTKYTLNCRTGAGQTQSRPVEVRVATAAEPATETASAPPVKGVLRPALSGNPDNVSQQELVARGFPPRPARAAAPGAYETWLEIVSQPMTIVTAPPVTHPDTFHGTFNATSTNWSGLVGTNGGYEFVVGQWNVPSVTGETGNCDYSSEWVGIDGNTSTDLIQDGTESDVCNSGGVNSFTYDAWIESIPAAEQVVFSVAPGDSMFAETWEGDSTGGMNFYGGNGWFVITDLTSQVSYYGSLPTPSGYTFDGSSVEWIVERPLVGGSLSRLANYSSAYLWNDYSYDTSGNWLPVGSQTYTNYSMTGSTTLSTASLSGTTAVSFTWYAFN